MRLSLLAQPLVLALVTAACAGRAGSAAPAPATSPATAEAGVQGGIQLLNRRAALNTMQLSYPELLRDAQVTGDVVVEVTLDALGRVSGSFVRSSTHHLFQAPGQHVARQLRFTVPAAAGERVTVLLRFAAADRADIEIVDGSPARAADDPRAPRGRPA